MNLDLLILLAQDAPAAPKQPGGLGNALPMIILMMGVVVAAIVMSVMLPLLDISTIG